MSFNKENRGEVLVVSIDLKRATVMETDDFRNLLLNEIENGKKKIVVDLEKCSFMDSTFLGSLVIALKAITKIGGDLRISGAKGDSQAIMELTGTSRVFQSFETVDKAVFSFH